MGSKAKEERVETMDEDIEATEALALEVMMAEMAAADAEAAKVAEDAAAAKAVEEAAAAVPTPAAVPARCSPRSC